MKKQTITILLSAALLIGGAGFANTAMAQETVRFQTTELGILLVQRIANSTLPADLKAQLTPIVFNRLVNRVGQDEFDDGQDRDCDDFATQLAAQAYFDRSGGSSLNNVDGLDSDRDGIACEGLSESNENEEDSQVRYPESAVDNIVDDSEGGEDFADFNLTFDLRSFGDDSYIPTNFSDTFEFLVTDGNRNVVADNDDIGMSINAFVTSEANEDDGYFFISEDDSEEFEISVTYVPITDGFYRLRLQQLNFNDRPENPDSAINLNREFETRSVYVNAD